MIRSDVIHRTQDSETNRVAVSARVVNSTATIRRGVLQNCGTLVKRQSLEADVLLRCFEEKGCDEISMEEFLRYQDRPAAAGLSASADRSQDIDD
jgi:hypothetical protein